MLDAARPKISSAEDHLYAAPRLITIRRDIMSSGIRQIWAMLATGATVDEAAGDGGR